VPILDPVLDTVSRYLGQELNHRVGNARRLNAEYFQRIDALDYAMEHDEGQKGIELRDADVILVGVSRTSKTPTPATRAAITSSSSASGRPPRPRRSSVTSTR
jgi:regulator of PEP synthase PpsR (kinase-PPPase family)